MRPSPIDFNFMYGVHVQYYTAQELMSVTCHVLQRKSLTNDEIERIIATAAARQRNAKRPSDSQNPAESLEYCI